MSRSRVLRRTALTFVLTLFTTYAALFVIWYPEEVSAWGQCLQHLLEAFPEHNLSRMSCHELDNSLHTCDNTRDGQYNFFLTSSCIPAIVPVMANITFSIPISSCIPVIAPMMADSTLSNDGSRTTCSAAHARIPHISFDKFALASPASFTTRTFSTRLCEDYHGTLTALKSPSSDDWSTTRC